MLVAVDPGVKTMGFVIFDGFEIFKAKAIELPDTKLSFDRCVQKLITWLDWELNDVYTKNKVDTVACEMPQFFNNQRGFDTASRGSLTEMCFCVGRVAGWADDHGAKFIPVPVTEWKGQLSKAVVVERIRARIDTSKLTKKPSHDWDAAGIGLYVKGKF